MFAEPAQVLEAGLGGREKPRVVHTHQVKREDDAALEFGGARIGGGAQVDDAALGPVVAPRGGGGLAGGGKRLGEGEVVRIGEGAGELKGVA